MILCIQVSNVLRCEAPWYILMQTRQLASTDDEVIILVISSSDDDYAIIKYILSHCQNRKEMIEK